MTPAAAGDIPRRMVATCDAFFDHGLCPGLAVTVSWGGELLVSRGWGKADIIRGLPALPSTPFAIGSITKQFVAAAVLQLCEHGNLSLTDPIGRWLPECRAPNSDIEVRHLLNHTSGVHSAAELRMLGSQFECSSAASKDPVDLVEEFVQTTTSHPPGTTWFYNNAGYAVLARIVERASAEEFVALARRQLIAPAGLSNTFFLNELSPQERNAIGHKRVNSGFATLDLPSVDMSFGSGNVFSSADDLVRWTKALRSGTLISAKSLTRMTTPARLADGSPLSYGYGLFVTSFGQNREISHDGSTAGFTSQLAWYPDEDLVIAVLANESTHRAEALEKELARIAFGSPVVVNPACELRLDLSPFVGWYNYGSLTIPVRERDGALLIRTPSGRVAELRPTGDGVFVEALDSEVEYRFETRGSGVEGLRVRRGAKLLAMLQRCDIEP